MDNIGYMESGTIQRIQTLLSEHQKVGIAVGKDPNLDQMGAALALYLVLRQMGKQISIASPSQPIVAISSLVGIDKVKQALDGEGGDLVVSFPYKEGEIEKVSYTLEDGYLNIVVKASEDGLSFSESDVQFKRSGGLPTLLFVVGTQRLSDLGTLFNPESLRNTTVINIDNHTDNQGFGDVVLVSPKFSSVSEYVAELLRAMRIDMDIDTAQNLFSGISDATDNFQNPATSYLAFEMAGILMQKGARRLELSPKGSKQEEQLQRSEKKPFVPFTQPTQQMHQPVSQQPQRFIQKRDQATKKPWEEQRPTQHVQQAQRPVQQQPKQQNQQQEEKTDQEAPPDWLAPKVYKSSTLV